MGFVCRTEFPFISSHSFSEEVGPVPVGGENRQGKEAYFYYQLKPGISSKIPYMRWSNAFMFNALSHYLLNQ
jgi:hypothetical protein